MDDLVDRRVDDAAREAVGRAWQSAFGDTEGTLEDDTDFFASGGQSLTAVRLAVAIRDLTGVEMPSGLVLSLRTPGRIASALTPHLDAAAFVAAPPHSDNVDLAASPRDRDGSAAPLTAAQREFWRIARAVPEATGFNSHVRLTVHGDLNMAAFMHALHALVRRQAVLRAVIDEGTQRIREDPDIDIREFDLRSSGEDPQAAWGLLSLVVDEPFDLAVSSPFRVVLAQISAQIHVLVLVVHHIAFDGWSRSVLVGDLFRAYAAVTSGRSPDGPPPTSFMDFARWQVQRFSGSALAEDYDFWRRTIALHPLRPFSLSPPGEARSYRSTAFSFRVPADRSALHVFARRASVTVSMVLLAAYLRAVQLVTGNSDICVATLVANRELPSTLDVVGLFANVQLVRVRLGADEPMESLAGRVRDTLAAAAPHQGIPFEILLPFLEKQPGVERAALLQLGFAVQVSENDQAGLAASGGVQFAVERSLGGDAENIPNPSPFDLTLEVLVEDDGILGKVEYRTDVDERLVRRVVDELSRTVSALNGERRNHEGCR